jgi:hypothetical protein
MVDKNVRETVTAFFWVGHQTRLACALNDGCSSVLEIFQECLSGSSHFVDIVGIVKLGSSAHDSFTGNDEEISEGDSVAVLLEDSNQARGFEAVGQTGVVFILEVNATIRASIFDSIDVSVVHEIVTSCSYETSGILGSWVVVGLNSVAFIFILGNDFGDNFLVFISGEARISCGDSVTAIT